MRTTKVQSQNIKNPAVRIPAWLVPPFPAKAPHTNSKSLVSPPAQTEERWLWKTTSNPLMAPKCGRKCQALSRRHKQTSKCRQHGGDYDMRYCSSGKETNRTEDRARNRPANIRLHGKDATVQWGEDLPFQQMELGHPGFTGKVNPAP